MENKTVAVVAGIVGSLLLLSSAAADEPPAIQGASSPYAAPAFPPTSPPAYASEAQPLPAYDPPPVDGVSRSFGPITGFSLALSSGYTRLGDRNGQSFGGRGVLMLHETFGVGFAGHIIGTSDMDIENEDVRETGMYGGLYLQGVLGSNDLIHSYVDLTLGAGGWCGQSTEGECDDYEFTLAEPTVNAELNLAPNVRVSLGVGYRQILDDEGGKPAGGLSGVVVRGSLVVGVF